MLKKCTYILSVCLLYVVCGIVLFFHIQTFVQGCEPKQWFVFFSAFLVAALFLTIFLIPQFFCRFYNKMKKYYRNASSEFFPNEDYSLASFDKAYKTAKIALIILLIGSVIFGLLAF